MIDPSTSDPIYLNASPAQTKGIELKIGAKWPNGMETAISDSLQDSRNVATRTILTNSPRQLAKANFSIPVLDKKLFVSADAQYFSPVTTVAQAKLGGYLLTNINFLTRKLTQRFDLSAGFYNVLNRRYAQSGTINTAETSILQDGRSFQIKLTYRPRASTK